MFTWKRFTDKEFWIIDAANNKIIGPLATEEYADHALKSLNDDLEYAIKEYKQDRLEYFSDEYLTLKALQKVKDIFLRCGSINISDDDARKMVGLLGKNHTSKLEIIDELEEEIWMDITRILKELPTINFQNVLK